MLFRWRRKGMQPPQNNWPWDDRYWEVACQYNRFDIFSGTQYIRTDGTECPCKHQNDVCRCHRFHTFGDALHKCLESKQTSWYKQQKSNQQSAKSAHYQRSRGVTVTKCLLQGCHICLGEIAAGIEHCENRKDNQRQNRNYQIINSAFSSWHCSVFLLFTCTQNTLCFCTILCLFHWAKIQVGDTEDNHHHKGKQRIKVKRNGRNKSCQVAFELSGYRETRTNCSSPGRNWCDNTDWCRGSVDNICQLFPGNTVLGPLPVS